MELPEQMKELFNAADEAEMDTDLIGANETDDSFDEPESEPRKSTVEFDADTLIRQRDAIIAEKQRYADEARRYRDYADMLERERAKYLEKPEEPVPAPDLKKDPVGYLQHERKIEADALRSEIEQLKTLFSEKAREIDTEKAQNQLLSHVANDERSFKEKTPDYDTAMQHLDQQVKGYFVSQGVPDADAEKGLRMFKSNLFQECLRVGVPMAETFYRHALQAGFKKKADSRISRSKVGVEAGSVLTAASRGGQTPLRSGEGRVTLDQYNQLPGYDPTRLAIANDKALFKRLMSDGEVSI